MSHITVSEVAERLNDRAEDICHRYLPNGKLYKGQWIAGDITGAQGESFKVNLEGAHCGHYKDWATNEQGDMLDLIRICGRLSDAEAVEEGKRLLGILEEKPRPPRKPTVAEVKAPLILPELTYVPGLASKVADKRGLPIEGPEMAGAIYGTLSFGTVAGFDSWILHDGSKKIAEARRMDGDKYPDTGNLSTRKSHTLRGSCKSWPLGCQPPKVSVPDGFPVVLVEGSPDYLAACALAFHAKREFLPVTMLGAGQSIHVEALPFFSGRDVLILAHPDEAGTSAAKRWAAQLRAAGGNPSCMKLEGGDLNDLVTQHGAASVTTSLGL